MFDKKNFVKIFHERSKADPSSAHANTLIQAFNDRRISGTSAKERFNTILKLTGGNKPGPGLHFDKDTIVGIGAGKKSGTGDTGFRRELMDSIHYGTDKKGKNIGLHRKSSNQIGHFLTAAHIGYSITNSENYYKKKFEDAAKYRKKHPVRSFFRGLFDKTHESKIKYDLLNNTYKKAMIGHEKVADDSGVGSGGSFSAGRSITSATAQDVTNFFKCRLDLIDVKDSQAGNSYQDLLLTWVGYKFGEKMADNVFSSKGEAARWLKLMLTKQDLSKVKKSDPFYSDAQKMKGLLNQFRKTQKKIHPNHKQPPP